MPSPSEAEIEGLRRELVSQRQAAETQLRVSPPAARPSATPNGENAASQVSARLMPDGPLDWWLTDQPYQFVAEPSVAAGE